MTIQVRPFNPSDREFILSLVTRFSEFELPEWRSANEVDNNNRQLLEQALNQPEPDSALFIAAEDKGALAGFVHLQTQIDYFGEKHGYIADLAVAKSFEGQGIGHLLLETAEAWAHAKGYRLLSLYVFADNFRARRRYEQHHFGQEVVKYVKMIK
jgi:ribosomal protein S18 acetylase RimI-like enzyme